MQLHSIHRQGSPEKLFFYIKFKGENEHKKVKNVIRPYLLLQLYPMVLKNRGVRLVGLSLLNKCGTKSRNIFMEPNIERKMRQKSFLSLLRGSPHKLVWHPAGKYMQGAI